MFRRIAVEKTSKKMPRTWKTFKHMFKQKCQDRQEESLVSHMSSEPPEPADGKLYIHLLLSGFTWIYQLFLQEIVALTDKPYSSELKMV